MAMTMATNPQHIGIHRVAQASKTTQPIRAQTDISDMETGTLRTNSAGEPGYVLYGRPLHAARSADALRSAELLPENRHEWEQLLAHARQAVAAFATSR
jgi:hypothetical protein